MSEQLRSIKRRVIVEKEKLERKLGTAALFSSAYGDVGSSIYYALGVTTVFALGASPLAILIAGVFYVFTVLTFAEGTTMIPKAGGTASFSRVAFNESFSFVAGWVDLLAYIVTISMSIITAVHYLAFFVPVLKTPIPITIGNMCFSTDPHLFVVFTAIFLVLCLMSLNIMGVKEATSFNIIFSAIDILTQLLLIVFGFILVFNLDKLLSYRLMGPEYWPSLPKFLQGIAIAMVAYTGLETVAQLSEEAADYKKTIPKSYVWLIIVVLIMYIGLPIIALSAMTPPVLVNDWLSDPIAGIAYFMPDITMFGHLIPLKNIFGIWVSLLAVTILMMATNAGIMGASRLAYSMGQHRQMSTFLFKLHRKFNTPYISILVFCGVAILLLLLGLVYKDIFVKLAALYSFASVFVFSVSHLSIIALRVNHSAMERPFKINWNFKFRGKEIPYTAVIGFVANIIVWLMLGIGEPWARNIGIAWLILGVVGYVLYRKKHNLPVHEVVTVERVVEAAYTPIDYAEVLVPTTGKLDAEMIQAACKIALRDKSRVLALYVIEVPMTLPLEAIMPAEKEKGENALDQAEMIGKEIGVKVDTRLVQARSAGKAIVEEAIKIRADLIMLGQPEKTALSEIFGAKTVSYVAQHAPCRVWIDIGQVQHNIE